MKIVNGMLQYDDGKQVKYIKSNSMGGVLKPIFGVIHYTGTLNAKSAIDWMVEKRTDGTSVSAHFHIATDGTITQLVPTNRVAWHAGKSEWKGYKGLNSYAVGVEISNVAGHDYTEDQINSAIEIGKAVNAAYKLREWVGHSDIAPGRKVDPGSLWPWDKFRNGMAGITGHPVMTTTTELNIRDKAVNGKILSVLPKGTKVEIINSVDGWSHVKSGLLVGFVSNKYLI